jgi:transcriptional antiterminator Rof (Rho-off)
MGDRIDQDEVGRCDFLDVLEEAVLRRTPVAVTLRDGTAFRDVVADVVTRDGVDRAVFRERGEVPVREIAAATRAEVGTPDR